MPAIWPAVLANVAFMASGASLRSRLKSCPSLDADQVLCQQGSALVLASTGDGTNDRLLRFGEECAVESRVQCLGDRPECAGQCGPCPCDFDPSTDLTGYMTTMTEQLPCPNGDNSSSRVLAIGLGGAQLVQNLLHRCPGMSIEAVELDADVIRVARDYFGLSSSEKNVGLRLQVEQADGLAALKRRKSKHFDAVIVDCFAGKGEVPESCRSKEFANSVYKILRTGGMLLQNMWSLSMESGDVEGEYKQALVDYAEVFDRLDAIRVPMPKDLDFVKVIKGDKF